MKEANQIFILKSFKKNIYFLLNKTIHLILFFCKSIISFSSFEFTTTKSGLYFF